MDFLLINWSGKIYCIHIFKYKGCLIFGQKTNFRLKAIFTDFSENQHCLLLTAQSESQCWQGPLSHTLLFGFSIPQFIFTVHHILGTSLLEAICGQFSCDRGWCLYGRMYARPNHLNYSVGCQCTLDWLGMDSSYYCTCGGTINLFCCWGELLILQRPDKSQGLLVKSGWFCHYFEGIRGFCVVVILILQCCIVHSRVVIIKLNPFTWGELLTVFFLHH